MTARRAFILVESVLSIFILFGVCLILLDSIPFSRRVQQQLNVHDQALLLCQQFGDQARAKPDWIGQSDQQVAIQGRAYAVHLEASTSSYPNRNLIQVTVTSQQTTVKMGWLVARSS